MESRNRELGSPSSASSSHRPPSLRPRWRPSRLLEKNATSRVINETGPSVHPPRQSTVSAARNSWVLLAHQRMDWNLETFKTVCFLSFVDFAWKISGRRAIVTAVGVILWVAIHVRVAAEVNPGEAQPVEKKRRRRAGPRSGGGGTMEREMLSKSIALGSRALMPLWASGVFSFPRAFGNTFWENKETGRPLKNESWIKRP